MTNRRHFAAALLALWIAIAVAAVGCGGSTKKTTQPPPPDQGPNPNSPVNAVLLLQWAMQHRDTTQYRTLFPTEYAFAFEPGDTAATNPFPGTWGYAQERAYATHLFQTGSSGGAAAASITMQFIGALSDEAAPGQNATYHRRVITNFLLTVQMRDATAQQISSGTTFYLVRGDSASLPPDLIAAGVPGTSGRWFIERWEENYTGVAPNLALRPGDPPARSLPTTLPTLGQLKVRYLPPPVVLEAR